MAVRIDNVVTVDDLTLPYDIRQVYEDIQQYIKDPTGTYDDAVTLQQITSQLRKLRAGSEKLTGISEVDELSDKAKIKGNKIDTVINDFVTGASGRIKPWDKTKKESGPIALRSIAKKKIMKQCLSEGRDFYYIDTGYFGNHHKTKRYHRITKNAMQWLGPIEDRPGDRFERTNTKIKPHTTGDRILICPPSQKAMDYWGMDLDQWMNDTVATIQHYTDRPIDIRLKQPRSVRVMEDTMENALENNVHCMVTFNSIAAIESLINGKPVFTMGPNAAHHFSNHDLADIENPFMPEQDQVYALMSCLAYHQFTVHEMRRGYAWAMLQELEDQ